MHTREDPSMQPHTDDRMEKWEHIECLSDILGSIVGLPYHDLAYEEGIVLFLFSIG